MSCETSGVGGGCIQAEGRAYAKVPRPHPAGQRRIRRMGRPGRLAGVRERERGSESPGPGVAGTWKVLGTLAFTPGCGICGEGGRVGNH